MLQSELHSSSILEAKLSPSNQPLFIVVHEENGLLAQLQIRITDGTQHWSGHIVADDIQASNDEMRTQKFALTRTALKAPTNELALHCDLQPSSNSLKILVKQRVQNSNVQKQISSLLIPRTSDEISLFSDPVGLQRAAEQECCSAAGPQFEARIFFEGKLGSPWKLFKINCRLVRMNFTIISSMFSRPRRRKLES